MAVVPHSIDIVASDMERSLGFYRALGLDAPAFEPGMDQAQIHTPGGASIGLIAEAMMRQASPDWITPFGQRVTFACRCDAPAEVDSVFARMTAAGHTGLREPWDAFWGQRYAFLADPDGNRVDLFAELGTAAA